MTIKGSGRSALILAAGIWIGFAGPSLAAPGDATASPKPDSASAASAAPNNSANQGSRHLKKSAHRKSDSDKVADKPAGGAKATDAAADGSGSPPALQSTQMSPSVANANAQLTPADTLAGNAKAMSDRASNILQGAPDNTADAQSGAGTPIIAADQLNDVDRALHENTPPAAPVAQASADTPVVAASRPVVTAGSDSTWDQTSLIGKIFIGFGALLTMASAARMFMA
jgi:hypothetical protein